MRRLHISTSLLAVVLASASALAVVQILRARTAGPVSGVVEYAIRPSKRSPGRLQSDSALQSDRRVFICAKCLHTLYRDMEAEQQRGYIHSVDADVGRARNMRDRRTKSE